MPVPKNKLRLGGMALRNGLLVHGPTPLGGGRAHRRRRDQGRVRPQAARHARSTPSPACAGSCASARRSSSSRSSSRACRRRSCRCSRRASSASRRGASLAGAIVRKRVRGVTGDVASALLSRRARPVRPARRRAGRLPRRRAQGDRRLRGRRRRRGGRVEGARALRLAPRRADAGGQHRRHRAAAKGARAPNRAGRRDRRAGLHGRGRRGLRVERAARRHAGGARAQAPGLRAPARARHARAGRAPARRSAASRSRRSSASRRMGSRPQSAARRIAAILDRHASSASARRSGPRIPSRPPTGPG